MNEAEAEKLVAVLEATYPNHPTKPQTATAYHWALADLPYPIVEAAIREALRSSRFFPTPAELRAVIAERLLGYPAPEEAWRQVQDRVRSVGHYGAPGFGEGPIAQAVDAIGWRNICLSETPGVERAHFLRAYEGYRERALREADLAAVAAGRTGPYGLTPRRADPIRSLVSGADDGDGVR